MNRRTFLGTAGCSFAVLSGCIDSDGTGDATPTATPIPGDATPVEDGTPTPDADVTVESVVDQWGYVVPDSPDSIGVMATDRQFVVADVRVEGGAYRRSAFAFGAGSGGVEPTTFEEFYRTSWGDEEWYEKGRDRGLLLFEVPGDLGSEVPRLTWPTDEWRPPEAFVRRLTAARPAMNATLAVPDASDGSTDTTVEIEVTNEGDVEGRYLGALNRVGPTIAYTPIARVSGLVDAGETTTFDVDDDWGEYPADDEVGDGEADVTYHLQDADGGDSLDIAVGE